MNGDATVLIALTPRLVLSGRNLLLVQKQVARSFVEAVT